MRMPTLVLLVLQLPSASLRAWYLWYYCDMFCLKDLERLTETRAAGCHLELPVSTTHTTVGAVVGMALVLQGAGAVNWNSRTDTFPYYNGISTIVSSW